MYTGNTEICSFFITTYLLTCCITYSRNHICLALVLRHCVLQCSDTVDLASGRTPGLWLYVFSKVQIVCIWSSWCHCIPKPNHLLPHLIPDWFYLSGTGLPRLSWKKRLLNGCSSVAVLRHSFNRPAIKVRLAVPLLQVIYIFTHSLACTVLHWKNYGLVNNKRLLTTHCVLKSQLWISQSCIFGLKNYKRLFHWVYALFLENALCQGTVFIWRKSNAQKN